MKRTLKVTAWIYFLVFFFSYFYFNIQSNILTGNVVNSSAQANPTEIFAIKYSLMLIFLVIIVLAFLSLISYFLHRKISSQKKSKPKKYSPFKKN